MRRKSSQCGALAFVDRVLATAMAAWGRAFLSSGVEKALAIVVCAKRRGSILTSGDMLCLTRSLMAAEDRRFLEHHGIDSRALLRAASIYFRGGTLQGASTITQQLVRVATNDYRLTIDRKLREMCIACVIDKLVPKDEQASAYLRVAYFGWQMNGCDQAARRLGLSTPLNRRDAAEIVARLRFPEPKNATAALQQKIDRRVQYIEALLKEGYLHGKDTSPDPI